MTDLPNNTDARRHALTACQHLANACAALNLTGLPRLDTQRDGCAYGEAHDALTITVGTLHPRAFAGQIIDRAFNDNVSMNTAARYVAEDLYHAAGQRQADTFDAWQDDANLDDLSARQAEYMTARALVDNADAWMRQTHADCCVSTPLPTY